MTKRIDTAALFRRMQAHRPTDPHAPVKNLLDHVVILPPAETEQEQQERWQAPQQWCREHVDFGAGDRWSCHYQHGEFWFSFSNPTTAVFFKLMFR